MTPPPPHISVATPLPQEGCDRIWKWWTDSLTVSLVYLGQRTVKQYLRGFTSQQHQADVREEAQQVYRPGGGWLWRGWTSHKPPEVPRVLASCSFDADQPDGLPYLRAAAEPEGRWSQLQPGIWWQQRQYPGDQAVHSSSYWRTCIIIYMKLAVLSYYLWVVAFKGTQEWEFFWLRFWILSYFIVSYA